MDELAFRDIAFSHRLRGRARKTVCGDESGNLPLAQQSVSDGTDQSVLTIRSTVEPDIDNDCARISAVAQRTKIGLLAIVMIYMLVYDFYQY